MRYKYYICIKYMIFIELAIYLVYIYSLIYLFIHIKPTLLIMFIFLIYNFASTYYISVGCNSKLFQQDIIKLFIIFVYSLICTGFFYFVHETWKRYKKNMLYRLFIFMLPFAYFMNIKLCEKLWNCDDYHTIQKAYPIYFGVILINLCLIFFSQKK
jgi:hypothetical protein